MNDDPSNDELFEFMISEYDKPFSGWDFCYIKDRMVEHPFPWSYHSIILSYLRNSTALLDMGTGGGEFLSSLLPLPQHTCATEGYPPNVPVAKNRLEPLGVKVFSYEDDTSLPFSNEEFDLIINRHESFCAKEIHRILKPGGVFITQQVGDKNNFDLLQLFDGNLVFEEGFFARTIVEFQDAGFTILRQEEAFPLTRIFDVGAIVYYFKCIPWELSDFSVQKYYDQLKSIHENIIKMGYIDVHSHRFILIAKEED